LQFIKHIKVRRIETRPQDAWYDMSLRQLRKGEVSFYRVKDFLTGNWLFKLCTDKEQEKILVKAVKCPAGIRFAQLEGKTMVFQKSKIEGMLYDVISLTQANENDKVSRKIVSSVDEVPAVIRENYEVKPYEEATGKKAPGKHLVTLTKQEDKKEIVTLFVLERAWPLSESKPEEKLKEKEEKLLKKKTTKKEVDTGQVWSCPICGKKHRLVHVETEKTVKHALRKPSEQT
jgi:rubrerythrin